MIQEAIDVIVILNALRALTGGTERVPKVPGWTELSARLRAEHRALAPALARIRPLADRLDDDAAGRGARGARSGPGPSCSTR